MPVFEKDLVLIYFENEPTGFARVEEIRPDIKKNWYHVRLLLLNLPLQTITWILRDVYIDGEEFTMGGHKMRLEKIEAPKEDYFDANADIDDDEDDDMDDFATDMPEPIIMMPRPKDSHFDDNPEPAQSGKIISFNDFKNRKK